MGTVYLLCKHKDKEQALIDEIDRLMAKTEKDDEDGEPLAEELKSYVYVEACVKEALRMVGPGAFLARLSSKDTEVGKQWIGKDTPLHMHTYSMHQNPTYEYKNAMILTLGPSNGVEVLVHKRK